MAFQAKDAWGLLRQTFAEWTEDKVPQLGASLAFYTALSIAPLLVLSLWIAAFFFEDGEARDEIFGQAHSLVGMDGAKAIEAMLENADHPVTGTVATVLSVITLLLGASGVFGQLQDSLNTIWEVKPKPGQGIWGFVRTRFLSFTMIMGIAFLLLVSLLLSAALAYVGSFLDRLPEQFQLVAHGLNFVLSTAVITLLFAMMFKLLPDVKMAWRDVWLGAIVTAILFSVGKILIGLYLGHSSMASSYGAAGSFVVLLVWVYYSAQILFFGAELTQVYANRYGSRIVPSENAVPVTEGERAQEGRSRSNSPA